MRRWISAALVMSAALVLAGASVGTAATADLGLKTPGQISVASDYPYKPFEYTDPGSTVVKGFDVDVVNAAAKTFGISKVTFVKQKFSTILLVLAQGRFDMVASATTITPERAKRVAFSNPYFLANQSILVRRGSDIKTLKDLQGKKIGVQLGTTGQDLASKVKGATLSKYELIDDAFNALAAGRVDAVVNDFAISADAAKSKKGLVVVAQVPTHESYGLAFQKDNPALRAAFNRGLATIRKNGTYDRIYKKWFGTTPPS
jgi:polar amino acid transport system substrate-binding protein